MKLLTLILAASLAGCATASQDERASLLAAPVNCETAQEDIAALKAAMPSRGERAKSVVQTATPVGAVSGVVTGSYRDHAAVLTGRTKDELTARIKEIQVACKMTETPANVDQ